MAKQNGGADGSVIINTQMDTSNMETAMDNFGKSADQAEKKMQKLSETVKKVGKAILAAFAVQKIIQFGKETVKAAEVQEEMERKLETVMRQRMGATEDMIQSVKDLTAEQQRLGVVGDEVQMSGAQQLATFLRTSDALKTLIPAMNNLAVQQNGVNVSASAMQNIGNLMGKVMQGQVSALTRVGISFSKAEEKILKYGNEQQKAATLARVITNNVGNMNEVLANTPAGRIQQIKNNFGDMLETIGMGIQNIMVPFLGVINKIVSALQKAATLFKELTTAITGVDSSKSPGGVGGSVSDTALDTEALAEAEEKEAEAKKKQNKEQKKYLSGLDEIARWETDKEDEEDEEEEDAPIPSTAPAIAEEATHALDGLLQKLKELAELFKKGFWDGLGDYKPRLKEIQRDFDAIKKHLQNIWNDPAVRGAFNNLLNTMAYSLGQIVGSMASMGLTMAQLLVGGFEDFLSKSRERIKQHLVTLFDVSAEIWSMAGEFAKAVAYIFEAFGGQNAQAAFGSILSIIYEVTAVGVELLLKFSRDIANIFYLPIIENAEGIRTAIDNTIGAISVVLEGLLSGVQKVADKLREVYDGHIKVFLDNIASGVSKVVGILVDGWNQRVAPVLYSLAERFKGIMDGPFGQFIDAVGDMIGEVIDLVNQIWTETLQPFLAWLANKLMPIFGKILGIVGNGALSVFENLLNVGTRVFNGLKEVVETLQEAFRIFNEEVLQPLGEYIEGKFTEAWTAISDYWTNELSPRLEELQTTFNNIVDIIGGALTDAFNWIKDFFSGEGSDSTSTFRDAMSDLEGILETIGDFISGILADAWEGFKTGLNNVLDAVNSLDDVIDAFLKDFLKPLAEYVAGELKKAFADLRDYWVDEIAPRLANLQSAFNYFKDNVLDPLATFINDTLMEAFKTVATWFLGDGVNSVKDFGDAFDLLWQNLKPVAEWITNVLCDAIKGISEALTGIIDFLTGVFTGDWELAWNGLVEIIKGVFDGLETVLKTPINAVIGLVNGMIDGVAGALNWIISGINSAVSIPPIPSPFGGNIWNGWSPNIQPIDWSNFHIPELAKGAVIPPNAPFMATLGDQRHGTNVEAPLETIKQAMRDVMGGRGNQYTVNAEVGGRTILQIVIDEAQLMRMQTGRNPFEMA